MILGTSFRMGQVSGEGRAVDKRKDECIRPVRIEEVRRQIMDYDTLCAIHSVSLI